MAGSTTLPVARLTLEMRRRKSNTAPQRLSPWTGTPLLPGREQTESGRKATAARVAGGFSLSSSACAPATCILLVMGARRATREASWARSLATDRPVLLNLGMPSMRTNRSLSSNTRILYSANFSGQIEQCPESHHQWIYGRYIPRQQPTRKCRQSAGSRPLRELAINHAVIPNLRSSIAMLAKFFFLIKPCTR
jgi:hypothetical protein